MTWSALEREAALAIEPLAAEACGPGWRLRLGPEGRAPRIGALVEDAWMLLDARIEGAALECESLAEANGRLRGGAKFALLPDDERVHVRAELPLQVGSDLATRLLEALRGCELAVALARGERGLEDDPAPDTGGPGMDRAVAPEGERDLSRLCEDTGWVFVRRASGHLSVDLVGTEGFSQARLERRPDGAVALAAEIQDSDAAAGACKQALGVFLLRCCGWMRMARGVAEPRGERVAPRFEVILAPVPSPAELSEALSALSVAVRFGAAELQLLARSEEVARRYLSRQPCGARPAAPAGKRTRRSHGSKRARAKSQATVQRP